MLEKAWLWVECILWAREMCAPGADGSYPDLAKLPGGSLVDMLADQLCHAKVDIFVFPLADFGPAFGQDILFHDVGKQLLVRAIGAAQDIVRPLSRR